MKKQKPTSVEVLPSVKVKLLQNTVLTIFKKFHINFKLAWDLLFQNPKRGIVDMVWEVEILLLKIHFICYSVLYYFFLKTVIGRIIFLLGLPCAYGFATKGSPWLLIFYYNFVLEGFVIHLICKYFQRAYGLLKEEFGSEFLREYCDNMIFHKIKAKLVIVVAYPVVRGLDQLHADARISSKFHEIKDAIQETSDLKITKEEVFEARDRAIKEVGTPWVQQVEKAITNGVSHGLSKVAETLSK